MAITLMIGSEIGNQTGNLGQGTLCCFLKKAGDEANYLLSCWHVLKDNADWAEPPQNKTIVNGQGQPVAGIVQGELTSTIDIGIAKVTLPAINKNPQMSINGPFREVDAFDSFVHTPVKVFGKVCKLKEAVIFMHTIDAPLKYPDGTVRVMKDVFSIGIKDSSTAPYKAPTSDGDSGALVTDGQGIPLGMIIGGDSNLSYAVKFSNIFAKGTAYEGYSFVIK